MAAIWYSHIATILMPYGVWGQSQEEAEAFFKNGFNLLDVL